jgi:hypothetical protein
MPYANVSGLVQSIAALPSAMEESWQREVQEFWVEGDSENLLDLQRDGATALIDLAGEYTQGRGAEDRELAARVIGRLSDIQVRDFALGSHNDETADAYWQICTSPKKTRAHAPSEELPSVSVLQEWRDGHPTFLETPRSNIWGEC